MQWRVISENKVKKREEILILFLLFSQNYIPREGTYILLHLFSSNWATADCKMYACTLGIYFFRIWIDVSNTFSHFLKSMKDKHNPVQ